VRNAERLCLAHFWVAFAAFAAAAVLGAWQMWVRSPLGAHIGTPDDYYMSVTAHGVAMAYDALMVPALNYAERDRVEGRLSPAEETALVQTTTDLLAEVEARGSAHENGEEACSGEPIRLLGYPVEGEADLLALRMLRPLLPARMELEIAPSGLLASDVVTMLQTGKYRAVCVADLPPSGPSKSRYLAKRIRAAVPEVRVLVGRWGPPGFTDEAQELLLRSDAHQVAVTLQETREELARLVPHAEVMAAVG